MIILVVIVILIIIIVIIYGKKMLYHHMVTMILHIMTSLHPEGVQSHRHLHSSICSE